MINYKNPLYGDSPEDLVKYWLDELEDSDETEKENIILVKLKKILLIYVQGFYIVKIDIWIRLHV